MGKAGPVGTIASEEVEPTAALVVGRLYARVQAAPEGPERESAWASLWWAVNALSSLSVAIGTATHFSVACNNHVAAVARMIENELGIDPFEHPMWQDRKSRVPSPGGHHG